MPDQDASTDPTTPMDPGRLRRLMQSRATDADATARHADLGGAASRFDIAIALVVANRTGVDWGWLDQDRATHEP